MTSAVMTSSTQPPAAPAQDSSDAAALDWFVRCRGGLSHSETRAFERWLAADPKHPAALQRWQTQWTELDAFSAQDVATLRNKMNADKARLRAMPARSGLRAWWASWSWGTPMAALASMLLVAAVGWLGWAQWSRQAVYEQAFATPRGQQVEVTLPDGSHLRLDTATRMKVSYYRQRRVVHLAEGQAMFQVQPDANRPFDVLAGPLRITVVGTRFSVRHTPGIAGADGVQVIVESGRVRVAPAQAAQGRDEVPAGLELGAGQQVLADVHGNLGPVSQVSPSQVALWQRGRVSFDDVPLSQVLAEFERYGDTHLLVRDPAVAALRVSGTFDPRRLDNFVRILPQALPVHLRAEQGASEIVSAP